MDTTPAVGSGKPDKPRPDRKEKPKPAPREERPARVYSVPAHAPRVEAGAQHVEPPTGMSSTRTIPLAGPSGADEPRFSLFGGIGLLLFLVAAVLGLALATMPASALSRVSEGLAERRQDVGFAVAATLATSAAIFVLVMAA